MISFTLVIIALLTVIGWGMEKNMDNTPTDVRLEAIKEKTMVHIKAVRIYNLGLSYRKLGRYQDEIESYKQAIRIKPDFAEAYWNLGVAYGLLGNWQEAIEAFKQAIRIKPDDAEAHHNLGITYDQLRRHQEAIEAYKRAIRIEPDYVEAHFCLGQTYLLIGDIVSALEEYKILKTLDAAEFAELLWKCHSLLLKTPIE